jgi:hypothetical protein
MNDNSEALPVSEAPVDSDVSPEQINEASESNVRDQPIPDHVQKVDTSSSLEPNHISNSESTDGPPTADLQEIRGEQDVSIQGEEMSKNVVELSTDSNPRPTDEEFVVVQLNGEHASSQQGTFGSSFKDSLC